MFFVSPSFPNINNAEFDCTWRLQAPEGMRVKIRWPVFHLDSCGEGKTNSKVMVFDGKVSTHVDMVKQGFYFNNESKYSQYFALQKADPIIDLPENCRANIELYKQFLKSFSPKVQNNEIRPLFKSLISVQKSNIGHRLILNLKLYLRKREHNNARHSNFQLLC